MSCQYTCARVMDQPGERKLEYGIYPTQKIGNAGVYSNPRCEMRDAVSVYGGPSKFQPKDHALKKNKSQRLVRRNFATRTAHELDRIYRDMS